MTQTTKVDAWEQMIAATEVQYKAWVSIHKQVLSLQSLTAQLQTQVTDLQTRVDNFDKAAMAAEMAAAAGQDATGFPGQNPVGSGQQTEFGTAGPQTQAPTNVTPIRSTEPEDWDLKKVHMRLGAISQTLDEAGKVQLAQLIRGYGVPNIKYLDPSLFGDLMAKAEGLANG